MKLRALCLVLLIGLYARPAAATPIVSIEPSLTTVGVNSSFFLDINITGVTDLFGFSFDVVYDPSLLQFNDLTEGDFFPAGATFFSSGDSSVVGKVTGVFDLLLTAIPGIGGDGTLARLNFTALGAGTSPVDLANLLMLDSNIEPISADTTSASVTAVGGPAPIPEPGSIVLFGSGLLAAWRNRRRLTGAA